jgi:hypothetical protein
LVFLFFLFLPSPGQYLLRSSVTSHAQYMSLQF